MERDTSLDPLITKVSAGAISKPSRFIELPDEIETEEPGLTVNIWLKINGQINSPQRENINLMIP